jgi:hypothetical protein
MIDTNQLNQVIQNAAVIKEQVTTNWPAICAIAVWLRADLRNLNIWVLRMSEWAIVHGGLLPMLKKVFWNPAAKAAVENAVTPK